MNNLISSKPKTLLRRRNTPKHRQTINVRFLSITAITLVVVASLLFLWHKHQTGRLAEALLQRADALLKENKTRAAAEYLQEYLEIKPENAEVHVQLAEVYDRSAMNNAGKHRAIDLYYQAVGWAPKEKASALRLRLGELLLETEQFPEAEKVACKLLDTLQPADAKPLSDEKTALLYAKAIRLKALAIHEQCQAGVWKGSEEAGRSLGEILEEALKYNTGDRAISLLLAKIYRESPQWLSADKQTLAPEDRNRLADRYMEEYVVAHPEDADAYLARYTYKTYYRLPGAEADLELALRYGATNLLVLIAKADEDQLAAQEKYRQTGHLEEAIPLFDAALKNYRQVLQLGEAESNPPNTEDQQSDQAKEKPRQHLENWRDIQQYVYVNIGTIQQACGKTDAAIATWKAGLEKNPRSILLNLLLADALLGLDRTEEVSRVDKSKGREGPLEVLEQYLGEMGHESGSKVTAANFERKQQPQLTSLLQTVRLLRGRWHYQRGEMQAALPMLEAVAKGDVSALQPRNEALQALILLGNIHSRSGKTELSIAAYEDASALDSKAPLPHLAAAQAWESIGRYDRAEKHLRQALAGQDSPQARMQLAETFHRMAKEKTPGLYRLLAMALGRQGNYEEALRVCREAAQKDSSPMPYITAAYAMLEGRPSAKDYERAEAFLVGGAEMHRDSPELLNVLAALRIQEPKIEEAVALLRQVVELRPRDVQAMNNLATVLVERPETLSEGKKLVEQAIAMAGPQAGSLDLQGVILLAEGKPAEAIPLFEKACAAPQADPRFYFHLAVAYQRIGNQVKSQESLKRARDLELEQQILTPSDKILLAELENATVKKR